MRGKQWRSVSNSPCCDIHSAHSNSLLTSTQWIHFTNTIFLTLVSHLSPALLYTLFTKPSSFVFKTHTYTPSQSTTLHPLITIHSLHYYTHATSHSLILDTTHLLLYYFFPFILDVLYSTSMSDIYDRAYLLWRI